MVLPEAQALEGIATPLRGAMIFLQREINTLPQPVRPEDRWFFFSQLRAGAVMKSLSLFLKPVLLETPTGGPVWSVPALSRGCHWTTHRYWVLAVWPHWPRENGPFARRH